MTDEILCQHQGKCGHYYHEKMADCRERDCRKTYCCTYCPKGVCKNTRADKPYRGKYVLPKTEVIK